MTSVVDVVVFSAVVGAVSVDVVVGVVGRPSSIMPNP